MSSQSLFLVHEVRYSRSQLRRIYKRHAAAMGWTTHTIMVDLYIEAWQQKRIGPLGDAITAHETSAGRCEVLRTKACKLAIVAAVSVVVCFLVWR